MRNYFAFMLLTLWTTAFGQDRSGSVFLGMHYQYVDFEGFSPKHAIGINGEIMMSNRFGVELSLTAANGYFNYGIASMIAPPVILLSKIERKMGGRGGAEFMALFLIIPALLEQTNFHIPVRDNLQLIPFISIYKFKYLYDNNPMNKYNYFCSGSIGTKLSLMTKNNWCISANYELSRLYRGSEFQGQLDHTVSNTGYLCTINIGYIFNDTQNNQ